MAFSINGKTGESQRRKAKGTTVNNHVSQLPKEWGQYECTSL
jgi:hypothetical protein